MSETINNQQETEESKLTPEQIEENRIKLDKFYEKQIPRLKKQLAYEELLTKIHKERFERFRMDFQMASAMAPDPQPEPEQEGDGKTPPPPPEGEKKRTLKRDPQPEGEVK